jgi:hypothetical protein
MLSFSLILFKKKTKKVTFVHCHLFRYTYFWRGELAEWSIATVLKTVVPRGTVGSNPTFSAK